MITYSFNNHGSIFKETEKQKKNPLLNPSPVHTSSAATVAIQDQTGTMKLVNKKRLEFL